MFGACLLRRRRPALIAVYDLVGSWDDFNLLRDRDSVPDLTAVYAATIEFTCFEDRAY